MTLVGILIFIVFLQNQAAVQFHHHYINNNYIINERSLVPQCQLVILVHFYKQKFFSSQDKHHIFLLFTIYYI